MKKQITDSKADMCSTQPFNPIMSLTYVTRSHSIHYNVAYDVLSPIKK